MGKQWARPLDDIMREAAGEYQPTERTPDMSTETTKPDTEKGSLVYYDDLKAMNQIRKAMDALPRGSRDLADVIAWFHRKYPLSEPAK